VYSLVLLAVTTLATGMLYFPADSVWLAYGTLLLASFAIYMLSVGWAISRGSLTAPEDSDSDSDSNETSSSTSSHDRSTTHAGTGAERSAPASVTTPLLPSQLRSKHRSLLNHIFHLILGFLAICLSGYVLSHSASSIVDLLAIPDVLFGVVVLSIATTLPEKFIAVMSGRRGNAGVLVANTAGSNIFLLTLCLGIVLLSTQGHLPRGSVGAIELGVLWGSTVAFAATVWLGARLSTWIGGAMVLAYVAFVVLEFEVVHH
jgi:Ca2+/H+ antiporter